MCVVLGWRCAGVESDAGSLWELYCESRWRLFLPAQSTLFQSSRAYGFGT